MTSSADISAAACTITNPPPRYFRAKFGFLLPKTASVGRGGRGTPEVNDVASGSVFTGQSKFFAGGQNSAACPSPNAPPVEAPPHFVVQARCFQWKGTFFSTYLQNGGDVGARASFPSHRKCSPLGPHSCCLEKKTLSHTHTHTLFCLPCVPSFLGVSFIALITTNKQERPGEAASPVYISLGDMAQAKYLLVPKREKLIVCFKLKLSHLH